LCYTSAPAAGKMTTGASADGTPEATSALHANIEAKKDTSYYYAHKLRETGEQPAPLPVPELLNVEVRALAEATEAITTYQFLDDGDKVKVYIPLDGIGDISPESISSSFDDQSFTLEVRNYKPNKVLRLAVRELHGRIAVQECLHKKLSSKIVVTLKKADSGKWFKLKK
jgi:hypothetical protein